MKQRWNPFLRAANDIPAGLVVFLVALPLCLGIAVASGAPVASGILSGAVAGIIVSLLSGSQLSVSGPAASLAVTVTVATQQLGSFNAVLVSVFLAGMMQIVFGFLRSGALASFFPHSVIKGMVAAVGLIIILKQIPHALGWDVDFIGDEHFVQAVDHETTFSEIQKAYQRMEPGAIMVFLAALLAIFVWRQKYVRNNKFLSILPAPLMAVVAGVLVNEFLLVRLPDLGLTESGGHLLAFPAVIGGESFFSQLPHPEWSALKKFMTWQVALTIAFIASIESLLVLDASDRLDPEQRASDPNRELFAQGFGNLICGFAGGLPISAVIVRSSANVYAGAKTRLASFVHGFLLLGSVLILPTFSQRIPLAAFAAVLIVVGFKMFNLNLLKKMWRSGFEQSMPFFVTIIAMVSSDLLTGVSIGIAVGLLIVIRMSHQSAITVVSEGNMYLVRFAKDVSFAHKQALKKILASLPPRIDVIIDGTGAHFIDQDILETVSDFYSVARLREIRVTLKNLRSKRMTVWGAMEHGKLQELTFGQ